MLEDSDFFDNIYLPSPIKKPVEPAGKCMRSPRLYNYERVTPPPPKKNNFLLFISLPPSLTPSLPPLSLPPSLPTSSLVCAGLRSQTFSLEVSSSSED